MLFVTNNWILKFSKHGFLKNSDSQFHNSCFELSILNPLKQKFWLLHTLGMDPIPENTWFFPDCDIENQYSYCWLYQILSAEPQIRYVLFL